MFNSLKKIKDIFMFVYYHAILITFVLFSWSNWICRNFFDWKNSFSFEIFFVYLFSVFSLFLIFPRLINGFHDFLNRIFRNKSITLFFHWCVSLKNSHRFYFYVLVFIFFWSAVSIENYEFSQTPWFFPFLLMLMSFIRNLFIMPFLFTSLVTANFSLRKLSEKSYIQSFFHTSPTRLSPGPLMPPGSEKAFQEALPALTAIAGLVLATEQAEKLGDTTRQRTQGVLDQSKGRIESNVEQLEKVEQTVAQEMKKAEIQRERILIKTKTDAIEKHESSLIEIEIKEQKLQQCLEECAQTKREFRQVEKELQQVEQNLETSTNLDLLIDRFTSKKPIYSRTLELSQTSREIKSKTGEIRDQVTDTVLGRIPSVLEFF